MDAERFNSAYRLALTIALVYILLKLILVIPPYIHLVAGAAQQSRATTAGLQKKLGAAKLEAALTEGNRFGPNAQIRCRPAERDWDYVCSYMPTPKQSQTRLEFGVKVDAARWVKVSRFVPEGTVIPPPR